jgi:host factor-I protein
MSKDQHVNVQEVFLNHVRKGRQPITIFLTNGVKLQGRLTWFDNFCLTLTRDGITQLVYKHAISTVMPGDDFQMSDIVGFEENGNVDDI